MGESKMICRRETVKEILIAKVYANPRYRGKQVILIHGKIFPTARRGTTGFKKLQSLLQQYPDETPTVVYVPTAETLILIL